MSTHITIALESNKINYKGFVFISLLSIIYIDYIAKNIIGTLFTVSLFAYLITLGFNHQLRAFKYFIILFIVLPPFPRNILDVYEHIQVTHTISYNVLTGMPFLGISMIQWLTLFFIIRLLYDIYKYNIKISKRYLNIVNLIIVLPIVVTIINCLFDPSHFQIREVIAGIRFPIYLLLGILFWIRYQTNPMLISNFLIEILVAVSIIYCVRVPFFLILSIFESTPSLDLGIVPHIPLAVMFSLFLFKHKTKGMIFTIIVCVFSLLSPSRGQIFMFFVLLLLFLWISRFKISKIKYILILAFLGFFVIGSMTIFNERLYEFFLWKLSEFSPESEGISESGLVRIYEFLNITDAAQSNFLKLVFGGGLSGYFTFDAYPFPFPEHLDLKSYQDFELSNGIYYHPHFFINIILLKFGLIGLFAYIIFIFKYFIMCKRKYKGSDSNRSFLLSFGFFFAISLLLDMHFRGYYAIMFPILYLYTYNEKRSKVA